MTVTLYSFVFCQPLELVLIITIFVNFLSSLCSESYRERRDGKTRVRRYLQIIVSACLHLLKVLNKHHRMIQIVFSKFSPEII